MVTIIPTQAAGEEARFNDLERETRPFTNSATNARRIIQT